MLTIFTSRKLETLADHLYLQLEEARRANPIAPFQIIVPQPGIGRWLTVRWTEHHGVVANLRVSRLSEWLGAQTDASDALSVDRWRWRILAALEDTPPAGPAAQFLSRQTDQLQRLRLAELLARRFAEYVLYRPEWVRRWLDGEDLDHWQAELFYATYDSELARLLVPTQSSRSLALFGFSHMAPLYLSWVAEAAKDAAVSLFWATPSRDFFADEQRRGEALLRQGSLLSLLGRQGRSFQQALYDLSPEPFEQELDPEPSATSASALQRLQGSLDSLDDELPAAGLDESMRVLCCASPRHELEMLYAAICEAFANDPALRYEDVVVLAPRLEDYRPHIASVFQGGACPLPFRITDSVSPRENVYVDSVLSILGLSSSAFVIDDVFDLLSAPALAGEFRIDADEQQRLRTLLLEAGLTWGLDAEHRAAEGAGTRPENSWEYVFERLLVGYAAGTQCLAFGRIAGAGPVDAQLAEALGRVVHLVDRLRELRSQLEATRALWEWTDWLEEVLRELFPLRGDLQVEDARAQVFDALEDLRQQSADLVVSAACFAAVLMDDLRGRTRAANFLAGGITFARLVPSRIVPARWLCLLGLDGDSFPRIDRHVELDLRAERGWHALDRRSIEDDRYALLEAVLSARETLYVSYTGFDLRDASKRELAMPAAELVESVAGNASRQMDYPAVAPFLSGATVTRAQWLAPSSFEGGDARQPAFVSESEPSGDFDSDHVLALSDMEAYLRNPLKHLARVHGLDFPAPRGAAASWDALRPDSLGTFAFEQFAISRALEGAVPEVEELIARGLLLPHASSRARLAARLPFIRAFAEELRRLGVDRPAEPVGIELATAAGRVYGDISLHGSRLIRWQPSAPKAHHLGPFWLQALALRAAGRDVEAIFVSAGDDGPLRCIPSTERSPEQLIAALVPLYRFAVMRFAALRRQQLEQLREGRKEGRVRDPDFQEVLLLRGQPGWEEFKTRLKKAFFDPLADAFGE